MIIKPKYRGFICTTTHPTGCYHNVLDQIAVTRTRLGQRHGPKKVLVIGASSGYGLAARITAAFAYGADTLGVFFEKPGTESKPGTAGWYNSWAFEEEAKKPGSTPDRLTVMRFPMKCARRLSTSSNRIWGRWIWWCTRWPRPCAVCPIPAK